MTALLGYSHAQLLGQELWQIGFFEDRQAMLAAMRELQEQQVLRRESVPLRTKDKKRRYVELVSTLYQTNGHQTIQCNLRDITERKQAEEGLLLLASIVSTSDDAILSKDLDGIITSWNTGAERMYGYSAQDIVGQSVSLLFPPDRQDEFTEIMERIRQGENVDHYETMRVRKDGSLLPVSVTVSPLKAHNGAIFGASDITRDISARRELESQREAFVGMVTHELRTPLTSLQGNIQLAQRRLSQLLNKEEEIPSEQQQTLEAVLSMQPQ
jgi:PAS domain S-box-containing protein